MESNKIQVIDEQGNELEFEVLFTFTGENEKKYVLYFDPEQEEMNVFASAYNEDGTLNEVESPEEWEMIEEVFQSFVAESTQEHEGCGCGCGGKEENSEEHQCCGGNHEDCGCGH